MRPNGPRAPGPGPPKKKRICPLYRYSYRAGDGKLDFQADLITA